MRGQLDLTPEEWDECLDEYMEVYRNSSGSSSDQLNLRIRLYNLGIDDDEVDYIVRTTRTK